MARLAAGIPTVREYQSLIASPEFAELERFSSRFIASNRRALADYSRRWVPDPLHQWSRQWEYPFVLAGLEALPQGGGPDGPGSLRVLDAGSGVTFFPFLLAERFPGASVCCCDRDESLAATYSAIAPGAGSRVSFEVAGLDALPYPDRSFDAVYCISVLEHTGNYPAILDQFHRVLRPGGILALTFDVSLDGRADVSPAAAQELLEHVDRRFRRARDEAVVPLARQLERPDPLTTEHARRTRPELLPWRRSLRGSLRDLIALRRPRAPFFLCTVYCDVWRRPAG